LAIDFSSSTNGANAATKAENLFQPSSQDIGPNSAMIL